jgi:hypothetical protein
MQVPVPLHIESIMFVAMQYITGVNVSYLSRPDPCEPMTFKP